MEKQNPALWGKNEVFPHLLSGKFAYSSLKLKTVYKMAQLNPELKNHKTIKEF